MTQPRPVDELLFEMKAGAAADAADGRPARGPVDPSRPLPVVPGEVLPVPKSVLRELFPDLDEAGTDWDALGREAMG